MVTQREPRYPFDHHDGSFAGRKHGIYEELRAACPVAWTDAHGGFWVVARYEDVIGVARDDAAFSSAREVVIPPTRVGRLIPLNADPPDLERYRRALNPFFARPYVESLAPDIQRFADDHIDRFIDGGRCDFVADYANPVPSMTTMRLLGIDPSEWRAYTAPVQAHGYSADASAHHAGIEEVADRIHVETSRRAAAPGDDLISHLLRLEADGSIDSDERHDLIMMTIFGGLETTMAAMAHALLYLSRHPDRRAMLAARPDAIERAVEELLRWEPPVQGFARTAMRDIEVGGRPIAEGETVFMLWAAANRDERAFVEPDEVRLDRFPNPHLTFGIGAHRCLGATLARVELRVMLERLLRRIPDFSIDESGIVLPETIAVVNGIVRLPATFPV